VRLKPYTSLRHAGIGSFRRTLVRLKQGGGEGRGGSNTFQTNSREVEAGGGRPISERTREFQTNSREVEASPVASTVSMVGSFRRTLVRLKPLRLDDTDCHLVVSDELS